MVECYWVSAKQWEKLVEKHNLEIIRTITEYQKTYTASVEAFN